MAKIPDKIRVNVEMDPDELNNVWMRRELIKMAVESARLEQLSIDLEMREREVKEVEDKRATNRRQRSRRNRAR